MADVLQLKEDKYIQNSRKSPWIDNYASDNCMFALNNQILFVMKYA